LYLFYEAYVGKDELLEQAYSFLVLIKLAFGKIINTYKLTLSVDNYSYIRSMNSKNK
jgi:hypothetical protein